MHDKNEVIMPVLGMNQDTGKIVRWLVEEGQPVRRGEPLFEVETDKAVAEVEAQVSGILSGVLAQAGDDVPVGNVIALILPESTVTGGQATFNKEAKALETAPTNPLVTASPLAARMAAEHNLDLAAVKPQGGRVEKADVLAYLQAQVTPEPSGSPSPKTPRPLASPKARRLAAERGLDLWTLQGSGPQGAVLASDVASAQPPSRKSSASTGELPAAIDSQTAPQELPGVEITPGSIWRIMAEHTAAAWSQAPHFFLLREVDASRLIAWRETINNTGGIKVTFTDLLVKLAAVSLRQHPRLNATYQDGKILLLPEVNIGLAVAVEDGLVVPVIHKADGLRISEIAAARFELVEKAHAGKLRPLDISGGTFTISNLGMYGVDAFLAVINAPQSAILAVGRIADRVVPVNGQVAIRPMMALSLSFDHRSIDGARGAQFLDTLAKLIEEPLGLIT